MTDGPIIPDGTQPTYDRFHFPAAYRAGDYVFVSGVIGVDDNHEIPETAWSEFTIAFNHLAGTLAAAGGLLSDIVEMTSFHVGMGEIMAFMKAKDEAIKEPYPAWSAIGTTGLVVPEARVEIKATAYIPQG